MPVAGNPSRWSHDGGRRQKYGDSLPPLAAQREIGRSLATLNDKIEVHQRICQTTAELRDALLPLLLTGQMSLPDSQIT
jgi:hypothetical protein